MTLEIVIILLKQMRMMLRLSYLMDRHVIHGLAFITNHLMVNFILSKGIAPID